MQCFYFPFTARYPFWSPAFLPVHWKDFLFLSISLNSSVYIIYQFLQRLYNSLVKICSINISCHYPYSIRRWHTVRKFQVFLKPFFFLACKIRYFFPFIAVRKKTKDTYGKYILELVFHIRRMPVIWYFCCLFWKTADKNIIPCNILYPNAVIFQCFLYIPNFSWFTCHNSLLV